jgi:hypothetical protein
MFNEPMRVETVEAVDEGYWASRRPRRSLLPDLLVGERSFATGDT